MRLTAGVSVEASGGELWFCGVTGSVWSWIQSGERLKHAQNTVGRGELQVFLRDVAHQAGLIPCLEPQRENIFKPFHQWWRTCRYRFRVRASKRENGNVCFTFTQSSMSPSSMTSNISCSSIVSSSGWEAWMRMRIDNVVQIEMTLIRKDTFRQC